MCPRRSTVQNTERLEYEVSLVPYIISMEEGSVRMLYVPPVVTILRGGHCFTVSILPRILFVA